MLFYTCNCLNICRPCVSIHPSPHLPKLLDVSMCAWSVHNDDQKLNVYCTISNGLQNLKCQHIQAFLRIIYAQ